MRYLAFTIAILFALPVFADGPDKHPSFPPKDPYFAGEGSWGQKHSDQWALHRVGFDESNASAWKQTGAQPARTVVAIIDTGLDWNHADIAWESLWRNPDEIPNNGVDDDGNGYVDDILGWNFFEDDNKPWDHDGHGTFVAGVIGATWNNVGAAGIDPNARLMILKALNTFGNTRASLVAQAIIYAVDNGANVINLSVGGEGQTEVERQAMAYAGKKGVLVVIASGNEGRPMSEWSYYDAENAVIVAATDFDDRRTVFSNWGPEVDIAAPGLDILSLRARYTDTLRGIPDVEYEEGSAYVGADKRYYRASGTSFAAPIIAGAASLIYSKNPALSATEVRRMLLHSARDVGAPGVDQYTGYGVLDAKAALAADPKFFIDARIDAVEVIQSDNGLAVQVLGIASASDFSSARIDIGVGETPKKWITTPAKDIDTAIASRATLAVIPASVFSGASVWTLRLIVTEKSGRTREARYRLQTD